MLFAYGSLRLGEANHDALSDALALGSATIANARLVDLGPYPALVEVAPATSSVDYLVVGELYQVDDAVLARLDVIKEHPALFQRRSLELTDGREAHVYVMHAEQVRGRKRIASGDWKQRFAPRPRAEFTQPRRYR